jgi:hypothetical protein
VPDKFVFVFVFVRVASCSLIFQHSGSTAKEHEDDENYTNEKMGLDLKRWPGRAQPKALIAQRTPKLMPI